MLRCEPLVTCQLGARPATLSDLGTHPHKTEWHSSFFFNRLLQGTGHVAPSMHPFDVNAEYWHEHPSVATVPIVVFWK